MKKSSPFFKVIVPAMVAIIATALSPSLTFATELDVTAGRVKVYGDGGQYFRVSSNDNTNVGIELNNEGCCGGYIPPNQFKMDMSNDGFVSFLSDQEPGGEFDAPYKIIMKLTPYGTVGIAGAYSSYYKLYVGGAAFASGGFISGSDSKFKENIENLNEPLSKILQLRGVKYNLKKEIKKHFKTNSSGEEEYEIEKLNTREGKQIGLVAQEVEALFPELVHTDEDGYKGIDYGKVTVLLIEAVKAQQKQIDNLQSEIDNMKSN